jgi:soluble lytic murein transglycosylase
LVVVLAAALVGCSSAVLLYSGQTPPPSQRPAKVTAILQGSAAAPPQPLTLEQFEPLLSEPRFRAVAEALEAEQARSAAEALQAAREREPNLDTPTLALWSGRLWEKAGDAGRALAACERAAVPGALLEEYGRLCAARALLAAGRTKEALARLRERAFLTSAEPERRLLEARTARANGERAAALETFRAFVAEAADGGERARAQLELGELLLAAPQVVSAEATEALSLARRAAVTLAAQKTDRARIAELERKALALLPPAEQQQKALPSIEERVLEIAALVEARAYESAEKQASELLVALTPAERFSASGCEAHVLRAKALSGLRQFGAAVEALAEAREQCSADPERGARLWYLSGRYAASNGSHTQAVGFFAEVEKRYPANSLADDARFNAAVAEEELGVDARATELLLSLPDDYPTGDMAPEGLFRLALKRMERAAWSDALGLLDRALSVLGDRDRARGFELSGREHFFRARALLALDKKKDALSELESLVKGAPLSYYMLQAYTWLELKEPGRAQAAVGEAEAQGSSEPFRMVGGAELTRPGFARMMELLRVGELDAAVRELDALGLRMDGIGSEILWGVALLYERAGFSKFSTALTRKRLAEVSSRWPVGQWAKAWELAFPRPYLDVVQREAAQAGVEPALVYAVMREESQFDADAVSPANAYGLMQLIVPTARNVARAAHLPFGPEALKRPKINVALGCRELSRLGGLFPDNPLLAVPAYNAGPGRAARWLRDRPSLDFDLWVERIPYQETRRYTKRVLSSRAVYSYLYERELSATRLRLPAKSGG